MLNKYTYWQRAHTETYLKDAHGFYPCWGKLKIIFYSGPAKYGLLSFETCWYCLTASSAFNRNTCTTAHSCFHPISQSGSSTVHKIRQILVKSFSYYSQQTSQWGKPVLVVFECDLVVGFRQARLSVLDLHGYSHTTVWILWKLFHKKCFVDVRGQRWMIILVCDNRKNMVTPITTS